MTTTTVHVGERVELARYSTPAGERLVHGQRIHGHVRVTDRPADGQGRSYLIDSDLEQDGYDALMAIVEDYLAQADALNGIPMATSILARTLDALRS